MNTVSQVGNPLRIRTRTRHRPRPATGPPARVSVVIPCYNYAGYLTDSVQSALSQDGVNVDIVIVDDCSSDDSAAVARGISRTDDRVRVIQHSNNTGPVQAFNDGLSSATGEFLVRLDADDMLTPGSLRRAVDLARAFPAVGLIYGRPLHFSGARLPMPRNSSTLWTTWPGLDWLAGRCRSGVNVLTSPEAFMRMSIVDDIGGQRPLAHTHDMEMWFRIAAVSDVAYIHGADQAWHREHDRSLSRLAESAVGITILEGRRDAFATVFDAELMNLPEAESLRSSAYRTLAIEALNRASYEFDRGRATQTNTQALLDFAGETYPNYKDLNEWKRLALRMKWGERWLSRHPWNTARPLLRIAKDRTRDSRWKRTGLYERH